MLLGFFYYFIVVVFNTIFTQIKILNICRVLAYSQTFINHKTICKMNLQAVMRGQSNLAGHRYHGLFMSLCRGHG